jgi:alpha-1,3-rhamnosyl/mannosyltransferase
MATETEPLIRVKLIYPEVSQHRGIGFYATHLVAALKEMKDKVELVEEDPHIVHYPFFDLFYPTLPFSKPQPTLVTIHDLTPLVLGDLYPKGIRGEFNLWRQKWSLRNVSAVLTDSVNSQADIARLLPVDEKRIFVTPLGVEAKFFKKLPVRKLNSLSKRLNLPAKFIMTVAGGPNPNKNLVRLARATERAGLPLVIVGKGLVQTLAEGNVHPELKELAQLKEFKHLILPGYVPDEDLIGLYQLAEVYCQASLYEGFGLPLLEAMAASCLIASSSRSSLPEIYPSETITFDPESVEQMETALKKVLGLSPTRRNRLLRLGRQRAAQFTWVKTALSTLRAYQWTYENLYRNF